MQKLYIVPTPIGNLEDITLRSIRILRETDIILAEDTRKTGNLLKHYDIQKKIYPFHQYNEHKRIDGIIQWLQEGKTIAVVSDAGTPGISDPGYLLVKKCIENNIGVECLPGPTALIPALVNSGLPADRFCFEGFLPHKKGRLGRIQLLAEENRTIIIYESPFRLLKTLTQLKDVLGPDRNASVSREISKVYEENTRGTIATLIAHFQDKSIKGEIVLVIDGKNKKNNQNFC